MASIFTPAPGPATAGQKAAVAPAVAGSFSPATPLPGTPAVAPGGNERPALTGGGAYGTPGQAPGAAHAVQTALGAALGVKAPAAVGGNVSAPTAATGAPAGAPSTGPDPASTAFGPPPSQLAANPAYVSFLNSLGLSDADLQNSAALRAGAAWNTEALGQGNALTAQGNALTKTNNQEAGVGLENSSQNLNAQALVRQATNARIAALQNGTANNVANIYATLAGQQATGAQNLANVGTNIAAASNIGNAVNASPTGAFAVGG